MEGPFKVNLSTTGAWLEFIHDRIGYMRNPNNLEQWDQENNHIKQRPEKSTYDNYVAANGYGGLPKPKASATSSSNQRESFGPGYDYEAAQNDHLTPLTRIWINQELNNKLDNHTSTITDEAASNNAKSHSLNDMQEDSLVLKELGSLIREKLDFDSKYHIICMIPTFTTGRTRFNYARKKCMDVYFNKSQYESFTTKLDSLFVTYHKYRIISKTFNIRMQHLLMSPQSKCDSLNLANIFLHFSNPNTYQFEVETDVDGFFSRMAHLLCFMATKKKYLANSTASFEADSIYKDANKVFLRLKACWAEAFRLESYYSKNEENIIVNGTFPYVKGGSNLKTDDEDAGDTQQQAKKVTDISGDVVEEPMTGDTLTQNDETIGLDQQAEEDKDVLKVDAESLPLEIDTRTISNQVMVGYNELFVNTPLERAKEQVKMHKKETASESLSEFVVELENNELTTDNIKCKSTEENPLVFSYDSNMYSGLKAHHCVKSPIYNYDSYMCYLIRETVRSVLPQLFSDFHDENCTIFKKVTLLNLGGWNVFNNLILHILLENGKTLPSTIDYSTLEECKESSNSDGLQELSLVGFTNDHLLAMFSNDRSYDSYSMMDATKDPNGIKNRMSEKIRPLEAVDKKRVFQILGNNVNQVNCYLYGDYVSSIRSELFILTNFLPNVREILVMPKTRESGLLISQIDNFYTSFDNDFEESAYFSKYFKNITMFMEEKPVKVINWKDGEESTNVEYEANTEEEQANDETVVNDVLTFDVQSQLGTSNSEKPSLAVKILLVCQVSTNNLETFLDISGLSIEKLPLANQILRQSPGYPIEQKKEFMDYLLNNLKLPVSVVDTFAFDYTEEKRILEEYLVFHANSRDGRLIGLENLAFDFDGTISWIISLLYYGWDVFKNPQILEEVFMSLHCANASAFYGTENMAFSCFFSLYMAKLFYENASRQLFLEYLKSNFDIASGDVDKMITQIENDCCNRLYLQEDTDLKNHDKTKRLMNIFFTYVTRPKQDGVLYEKQHVKLTPEKIFIMAIIALESKSMKYFNDVMTLGSTLTTFSQVFEKTMFFQTPGPNTLEQYNLPRFTANLRKDCLMSNENFLKHYRKKQALKLMYEKELKLDTKFSKEELDLKFYQEECVDSIEMNLLHFMLACPSIPTSIVLAVVEKMTAEQLLFVDTFKNTCLHVAIICMNSDLRVISKIIEKQPKLVTMMNGDLNTPLHLACFNNIDRLLLIGKQLVKEYGASVNVVNACGMTPYEIALLSIFKESLNKHFGFVNSWSEFDLNWLYPTSGLTKQKIIENMIRNKHTTEHVKNIKEVDKKKNTEGSETKPKIATETALDTKIAKRVQTAKSPIPTRPTANKQEPTVTPSSSTAGKKATNTNSTTSSAKASHSTVTAVSTTSNVTKTTPYSGSSSKPSTTKEKTSSGKDVTSSANAPKSKPPPTEQQTKTSTVVSSQTKTTTTIATKTTTSPTTKPSTAKALTIKK
ncbi:hypothetical protein C9374_006819 [Naegleria lovaniensis]|uniref:Uncharacterized protein n=1 Tax=Naegleria lovaniensis TaxID=51637 RepID=A0AA88GYB8_NAELO|nr:uncharacterized protein C9374_006819 [Naegleria lovaniensis]KAG2393288.1 hypothetical protein C9374_006819 [Naegleria lovaniensis]